jgi:hypothetical protein
MPYQPYDTEWTKPLFGVICLLWFMISHGLFLHLTSVGCYNCIYVPFTILMSRICEIIGTIIISFGRMTIQCESFKFNKFNYIDPVFTTIQRIGSLIGTIKMDIGHPTFQYHRSNVQARKTSSGEHLCSFYARKRRRRQRFVISGSNISKIDDSAETPKSVPPCSHPVETYNNYFYPIDDPSCQDTTWYDAISP